MPEQNNLEAMSSRAAAIAVWEGSFGDKISKVDSEIYAMCEAELERKFTPTPTDFFLRKRFWELTEKAQASGVNNRVNELYDGICSRQNFYKNILRNDYKFCWILLPIKSHMDLIEESLYFALKKMRDELLTMQINEKTAGHFLKAIEYLSNRFMGPVVQKIESKNLNLELRPEDMPQSPDDLAKRYADLKTAIAKTVTNVIPDKNPE